MTTQLHRSIASWQDHLKALPQDREVAFPLCHTGKRLVHGTVTVGSTDRVTASDRCPRGSRILAVFHTHPGGPIAPSDQDMKTAYEMGLPFACIGDPVSGELACWRPHCQALGEGRVRCAWFG